jgi:hypothetical protein
VFDRFRSSGLEVVCIGAFETAESCDTWKQRFGLGCPVVSDEDGVLFRRLTNGWVPCNILVGPDGTVLFAENEFDETGYVAAITALYERAAPSPLVRQADQPAVERRVPSRAAARIVVLGGGVGGLVTARELRRRLGR